MPTRNLSDIVIGDRSRKNMGDIAGLAVSIQKLGLLQPIGIRPDNTLVCGERRICAYRMLDRDTIDVNVCKGLEDELKMLEAERDENTCREPMTPLEAENHQQKLMPKYKAVNEVAQQKGREEGASKGGKTAGRGRTKIASPTTYRKGKDHSKETAHQAAASTDYSAATLKKVTEVREAAEKDPKTYKPLVDELGEKGAKVDRIHKKFKAATKEKEDKAAAATAKRKLKSVAENGVYHSNSFELAKSIPDESCALVFTDPPYDRKALPMFGDLGGLADRILVDGGSLITYCGQYVLREVIDFVSPEQSSLRLFWIACCLHTGGTAQMREYGIKVKWKPMLWFVKGEFRRDRETWIDDLVVSKEEKTHHPWQQSIVEAKHFIEPLSRKGELVVDPFCGGGTTAVAAKDLGRQWWTADINETHVLTARNRLNDTNI